MSRGDGRHGSCGVGLGETVRDSLEHPELILRVKDIGTSGLIHKLARLRDFKLDQLNVEIRQPQTRDETDLWADMREPELPDWTSQVYRNWADAVTIVGGDYLRQLALQHDALVFEGAQGVLIDEWFGFHPYTTWSTTTHQNALQLLDEIHFDGDVTRLGIMRAYTTRHGPGPFVTEDNSLELVLKEYHNGTGPWQGVFRYGHLDFVAHQYALDACGGADALVVTGLDRVENFPIRKVATGYELTDPPPDARQFLRFDLNGMVRRIIPGTIGDVPRRARLTELVQNCRPHYEHWESTINDFLTQIGDRLGLPIFAASFGPTAADKRALVAC
jgi:adenylosuccinate synthase